MKLFRIYTEDKNQEKIKELLSISFDGFTVIRANGAYKGKSEDALIIEIYTDNTTLIKAIANSIKGFNNQDCLLVTATDCKFEFI